MKKSFIALVGMALLFAACNNNKQKENITITDKEGKNVTLDPGAAKDAAQDMLQMREKLSAMAPLSSDELRALVPDRVMDAPLTNADVSNSAGTNVASAEYKLNDTASVKLDIIDCAGPGGAGFYNMQFMNMLNMNSDDEDEYMKTIEFEGGKALENCRKKRNRCSLTFFNGDRFLVSLQGNNTGIDALKEAAKGMDLK